MFVGVFTLGGAIVQLPLGRLSDRMDRRFIIAFVCIAAAAIAIALATFGGAHRWTVLPLIGLFGTVALPLYGLSVAHANDRIPRTEFVETSATLLLINSLASVLGPTVAALVMGRFGTQALFFYTAAIHVAMAAFTILRMGLRDAPSNLHHDRFEAQPQQGTPASAELDPRAGEEQPAA